MTDRNERHTPTATANFSMESPRILVVDDTRANLNLLRDMLQAEG